MNCLDYRRELLARAIESPTMREHRLQCVQCTAFRTEHLRFESRLQDALQVPVPPAFENRVIERVFSEPVPTQMLVSASRRRWLLGAAAAAAAGLIATPLLLSRREDPLALGCIQWVIKEEAKSIMMGAMPREEAVRVLAATLPLERIERLGQVRHIAPCPFNDGTAYHVVLSRGEDKITLLVMPEGTAAKRSRAQYEGMAATVITAGTGSVGIVGPSRAVVTGVAVQIGAAS